MDITLQNGVFIVAVKSRSKKWQLKKPGTIQENLMVKNTVVIQGDT
jgi:hypothetical protein